jgi:hypothetical protein
MFVRKIKFALADWKAVAPFLETEGILKQALSLLASYCILYARWREAAADVEKNGQIITITSTTRTGMTQKPVTNPAVHDEVIYQAAPSNSARIHLTVRTSKPLVRCRRRWRQQREQHRCQTSMTIRSPRMK